MIITLNAEKGIVDKEVVGFIGTLEQYMEALIEDIKTSTKYVFLKQLADNPEVGVVTYYSNKHGVELTKIVIEGEEG